MYFPLVVGVLCLSLFCCALLCVLSSFATIWKRKREFQKNILLTVPRRYFFCGSFMFLFCLVFAMSLYASVYMCFVITCWKRADWHLGSRLWCLTVSLSLSHWYPGSGVVLDCIDSLSLHPYLLRLLCFYRLMVLLLYNVYVCLWSFCSVRSNVFTC